MGPFIRNALTWVSTVIAVFLVYYFIPSKRISRKRAWIMAWLIGPILQVLRILLGIYARYAVSFHKIYGVLAVIPLSILWVQLSWAVLLSGALFLRVAPRKINARR
jgi:membrane protein